MSCALSLGTSRALWDSVKWGLRALPSFPIGTNAYSDCLHVQARQANPRGQLQPEIFIEKELTILYACVATDLPSVVPKRFGHLTAAEINLLQNASIGELAVCGPVFTSMESSSSERRRARPNVGAGPWVRRGDCFGALRTLLHFIRHSSLRKMLECFAAFPWCCATR